MRDTNLADTVQTMLNKEYFRVISSIEYYTRVIINKENSEIVYNEIKNKLI